MFKRQLAVQRPAAPVLHVGPNFGLKRMVLAMLVAVSATVAMSAWAHQGGGPGMGPGGRMGHGDSMLHGGMSGRQIDHVLDGLSATDAQRTQIKQIMEAATKDLVAQHEARRTLRDRATQLLLAPSVDAAAVEQVRQQMLQQHDQSSKRMVQAMLDATKVLSPEQRAKLAERMKQRSEIMRDRMQRMQRDGGRR